MKHNTNIQVLIKDKENAVDVDPVALSNIPNPRMRDAVMTIVSLREGTAILI
jgi:hypothetical protein